MTRVYNAGDSVHDKFLVSERTKLLGVKTLRTCEVWGDLDVTISNGLVVLIRIELYSRIS